MSGFCRFLVALLGVALIAAAMPVSELAPADEYFGKMQMSGLGIRYSIQHLRVAAYHHDLAPRDLLNKTLMTDDAFFSWTHKYRHDSWIEQTGWALAELYALIPGPNAHTHRLVVLRYLAQAFPRTKYAHNARILLAKPLPDQPAAWTMPTPVPPPPTPSPTPSPSASPGQSPSPSESPSPS
jgi:hypothetical protein